jgi:hypothetical protein
MTSLQGLIAITLLTLFLVWIVTQFGNPFRWVVSAAPLPTGWGWVAVALLVALGSVFIASW